MPDWLRLTQTFGIFSAGYLVRPVGGIVIAHFGDRLGRKRTFAFSVLLMALPTLAIGLLPTYKSIGGAASLLLLLMRILQGAAVGGEAPGAWTFVAEHAPPGKRGLFIGLLTSGLTMGIFFGSLSAAGLNTFCTPIQIEGGLWRLPFIVGGIFGIGALFLRRQLSETPVFLEMQAHRKIAEELPLRLIFKQYARSVISSIASTAMLSATIAVLLLMTPTLLHSFYAIPLKVAQSLNLLTSLVQAGACVAIGLASDRFGARRLSLPLILLLVIAAYGLFLSADGSMTWSLPWWHVLAGVAAGSVVLVPLVMEQAFPVEVRFTGVSFAYNTAQAIVGGLTPFLVSLLMHKDKLSAAHYLAVFSAIGWIGLISAPKCKEV